MHDEAMGAVMAIIELYGFERLINKFIKAQANKGEPNPTILRMLTYIGEKMCTHARNVTPGHASGGYDDQTGNLRSSIGFGVLYNGELQEVGGFKRVEGHVTDPKGQDPTQIGEEAIATYAEMMPRKGYCIVVVAGMNYARYVEDKGYNVLHLTRPELRNEVQFLAKQFGL
mgnify:CR=1 FL=1